jgi:hypothetical protein
MTDPTWKLLTTLTDHPSALLLADGLSREGIGVRLMSDAMLLGQASATRVYVEAPQLHRARLLISQDWSDEELTARE